MHRTHGAFFDMHGNVYEWTADWWSHLTANPVVDPIGPARAPYPRSVEAAPGTMQAQACFRPDAATSSPATVGQYRLPCWFPKAVARELCTEG